MLNRVRTTSISVRVKLFASAGLLLVLMAVIGMLAIMNLSSVNTKAGSMYRDRAVPLQQLGTVEASLVDEQRINLRRILVGDKDPAIQTGLDAEIAADEKAIADEFGAYKATLLLPAEEAAIAQFDPAYASYQALRDETADLARAGSTQEATAKNLEALDTYKASIAALDELTKINVDEAARLAKEIESTYGSARLLTLIVLVIAIVLGSAVSFLITRGILKSIKGLIGMSEAVAAGDLTVRADADRKDEFGRLSQAINAMVESLAGLVGRIGGVSQALLASSEQMAATSEQTGKAVDEIAHAVGDVASGAERQVRMVESARSSVDEVVSAVKASADSAKETAEAAGQARSVAEEGVSAAALASQAMGAVRDSTEAVTAAIRGLGQKSEEIGGIVETITGIAGQTNLLALNAAIEAARAGEQGRGFAVVADEVRKLAEESQQAAASIAGLIGEIQSETQKVVSVVEDGAKRTEDGAQVVEQTREAFLRIGTAVDEMTARVEQIAGASLQVASGATRVQEDMNEVAAVAEQSSAATEQVSASTQETTASAQEIAASAQELARTAEELGELVGQFTV